MEQADVDDNYSEEFWERVEEAATGEISPYMYDVWKDRVCNGVTFTDAILDRRGG